MSILLFISLLQNCYGSIFTPGKRPIKAMVSTACTNCYVLSTGVFRRNLAMPLQCPSKLLTTPTTAADSFASAESLQKFLDMYKNPLQTVCGYQTACSSSKGSKWFARTSQGGCNIVNGLKICSNLRTQNLQV